MSTNRNTKGQFAQKTAPTQLDRIEDHFFSVIEGLSKDLSAIHDKLDQIQRDIDQVRTLAHQTRTNSRANTVILNKTLAGVDLLKSVTVKEGRDTNVVTPPAQPEEPKAEPWVPKENEWVVCISGFQLEECGTNPRRVVATPWDSESVWIDGTGTEYLPGISCGGAGTYETIIRPATTEEIAEAEGEEKLKKLVFGASVDTPRGHGIYHYDDDDAENNHWVILPGGECENFNLDQLTPLT